MITHYIPLISFRASTFGYFNKRHGWEDIMQNQKVSINSPLGIISLFFIVCEFIIVYGLTSVSGSLQWVLTNFAILLIIFVGVLFFIILFTKPYLFYPPSEYSQYVKPGEFIEAMRGRDKLKRQATEEIVANTEDVGTLTIQSQNKDLLNNDGITSHQTKDAVELFLEQKYKESRDAYLDLAERSNDNNQKEYYRALAAFVLSYTDFSKSEIEFDNLLENTISHHIYYWYAASYLRKKQYGKSIEILNKGIEKSEDINIQQILSGWKIIFHIDAGEYDQAEKTALDLVENELTSTRKARVNRLLGDISLKRSNVQDATQYFLVAYKADPTDETNLREIADFFNKQNNFIYELYFRLEVVKIKETADNYVLLGNCYLANNLNNLSMRSYTKASDLAETDTSWILGNIGNLYNNLGLFDIAISNLKKALVVNPSDEYSHNRLSSAYSNLQQESEKENQIIKKVKI